MPKKTLKYYLKFTLICLLIMLVIAFVLPALILYGGKLYDRVKGGMSPEEKKVVTREEQIKAREKARNQGVLLDETPEELLARVGIVYHEGDSLIEYYADKPIKVRSDENEFKQFCIDYFGDGSKVKFFDWAGEVSRAEYMNYLIVRTELFNPEEYKGKIYYVEQLGLEGMTDNHPFFYDATGKYALLKHGGNEEAIAKFLGLSLEGKDENYNPFVNQKYMQEKERLEEDRSVGVILETAPEELAARSEDTFDGTLESLYLYYGASEAIKVRSDGDSFEDFCKEFFFDHPEPVTFYRRANETTLAICGEYEIYRTEFFNPMMNDSGHLYYEIDGFEDGMSLITEFAYDLTGKYAMIWYDCKDSAKYVLAKFIGLNFSEENPYVSPIDGELEKLNLRGHGKFEGDIWKYVARDCVVRVESNEEEFVQYCDEFFKDCEEKIVYWKKNDEISTAECGDYLMLRSQFFDPIRFGESLLYEDDSYGDAAPLRSEFFYDCTGKYALVYTGFDCKNDCQNELCIKFLGF